jgi:hypothetical protein
VRRRLTLAATWVVATLLATFVVSLGVGVVTSEVTTRRPPPLALVRAAVTTTTTTTAPPPTTTTTAPPPPTTTTTTTVRPPTTTTAPPAVVRTGNGRGGSVSVRFTARTVGLVVATPSPGFAVRVYDRGPERVIVEFRSDDHRTQVFARAGDPEVHLDEDDDRDGGFGGGGHGGPGRR